MSKRKIFLAIAVIVSVPIAALGVFIVWWHLTYYDELNYIKEELQKIPGVTLVRANGVKDVTLEDIWAEVEVCGKGRLDLFALTRASVTSGDNIRIGRIGDLLPRYRYTGTSVPTRPRQANQ